MSLETGCEQLELKWTDLGRVMKKGTCAPINLIFRIPAGATSVTKDHSFQTIYCTDSFKNNDKLRKGLKRELRDSPVRI